MFQENKPRNVIACDAPNASSIFKVLGKLNPSTNARISSRWSSARNHLQHKMQQMYLSNSFMYILAETIWPQYSSCPSLKSKCCMMIQYDSTHWNTKQHCSIIFDGIHDKWLAFGYHAGGVVIQGWQRHCEHQGRHNEEDRAQSHVGTNCSSLISLRMQALLDIFRQQTPRKPHAVQSDRPPKLETSRKKLSLQATHGNPLLRPRNWSLLQLVQLRNPRMPRPSSRTISDQQRTCRECNSIVDHTLFTIPVRISFINSRGVNPPNPRGFSKVQISTMVENGMLEPPVLSKPDDFDDPKLWDTIFLKFNKKVEPTVLPKRCPEVRSWF